MPILASSGAGAARGFGRFGVAPVPTVPGTAYAGGYYAGIITVIGNTYAIIVAPKATGYTYGTLWKTSASAETFTTSADNGLSNSNSMNDAVHPAAQFCRSLTIGGFTDWYLPSINELTIIYNNLNSRTSSPLFKSGGAEAFADSYHWSSTEFSSPSQAYEIWFGGGNTNGGTKTNTNFYTIAVRKVLI